MTTKNKKVLVYSDVATYNNNINTVAVTLQILKTFIRRKNT